MHRLIRLMGPVLLLLAVAFLKLHDTAGATNAAAAPIWADAAPDVPNSPEPSAPAEPDWAGLGQQVEALAAAFPGRMSVVAVDLTTGERYAYREYDEYLPASTVKVAVALCYQQAIARGEYTWDTPVAYTEPDFDPDEVTDMEGAPFGTTFPVGELVDNALRYSSNVALRMLTRELTSEKMSDCTRAMGGEVTRGPEGSTPVTATAAAAWWQALFALQQSDPALAEPLLEPLRNAEYRGRILAGTPRPELVTHKFGSVDDNFHDTAIVWGERPYILVVMTEGAVTEEQADDTIAAVAGAVWNALDGSAAP
jgi:beta-lactamase class A